MKTDKKNQKQSITVREKKLKDDFFSIYLDYYPPVRNSKNGKETRREFLNLKVYANPVNDDEKTFNQKIRNQANDIRNQRAEFYENINLPSNDFLLYFRKEVKKRENTAIGNVDIWNSSYLYLYEFTKGNCNFNMVDEHFCEDFKLFLNTTHKLSSSDEFLSQNSKYAYFNKFKAVVNEGFNAGIFKSNPLGRVKGFATDEAAWSYLSQEEITQLENTACDHPLIKSIALLISKSGLLINQIQLLRWIDFSINDLTNQTTLMVNRKGIYEKLIIDEDLTRYLPKKNIKNKEFIFAYFKSSTYMNSCLKVWLAKAGIYKKERITFQSFRDSFAVLKLKNGYSLRDVSYMLGHTSLQRTQRYLKAIE